MKQLKLFTDDCKSSACQDSCYYPKCKLCSQCISEDDLLDIAIAWREQESRHFYERALPRSSDCMADDANQSVHKTWLCRMCSYDPEWCDIEDLKS